MSKLAITPIGTCRINTPLRHGVVRYPIEINTARVYGFTHTTEEALQQIAFLAGERQFDEAVLPILFRPQSGGRADDPIGLRSDVYVVEISSAKCFRVGDIAVQSNYLSRYFAEFLASAPRAKRFWALAGSSDASARNDLTAFLGADPVYRLYSESDRELLRSISMRTQSAADISAGMALVVERLGKERVVFVTHVNAHGADGAIMPARDRVIGWTRLAAERLGVPCFDPSSLMQAFGQEHAMERDGLDTMHFTNAFSDRWYSHFHNDYILARLSLDDSETGPGGAIEVSPLAASIAATLEHDDFFEGSRQLFDVIAEQGNNPALCQLSGQVYARIGDYHSVVRALEPVADSPAMTSASLHTLMRAQFQIGNALQAIEIADRLLADEYESIELYEIAGLAAERLGRLGDAARYAVLAFRLDPAQHRFAIRVLDGYRDGADPQKLSAWKKEVSDRLSARADIALAQALAEWAVAHRDETTFRTAATFVARSDIAVAERLIEEAAAAGMLSAAAEVMSTVAALPDINGRILRNFRKIAESWSAQSAAMLESGQTADAFALAEICRLIVPGNATARNVERAVLVDLRNRIRDALVRRDHASVIAMGDAAGRLLYRRPEIAMAYAKALLATDRADAALQVIQEACATIPDSVELAALHAQISALRGDVFTALKLYGHLHLSADPLIERYRTRIDTFLEKAARTGPRLFRTLVAEGQFEQALELAGLVTMHTNGQEQIAIDMQRLRRALRIALQALDEEETAGGEAMRLLRVILAIDPDDARFLRLAALEAMRVQEFEAAIEYWQAFDRISPGIETTDRNINRCQIQARRKADLAARSAKRRARDTGSLIVGSPADPDLP